MHRAKASVRTISAWGEQMLQKVLPEE
jgi:hypothetical protein